MITESNKDIELLVLYLDQKVIELRSKYPKSKTLIKTIRFYNEVVIPWMETFPMSNQEVDRQEDEELKNKILDLINFLNKVLQK